MRFRRVEGKGPELDIAPLIDVVFLLIIFFLLSSSYIMQPGIPVKLPYAETRELQPREDILILIDQKERIFLNHRPTKWEDLYEGIKGLIKDHGSKTAIIQADGGVRHARVVEVLDVAKVAGIERLAIATQPKERED